MTIQFTNKLIFNFGFLLDGLPGASCETEINYPAVKLDELILQPLKGQFRASRTAQGVYVEGVLFSRLPGICSRCTESFMQEIEIELDDHYYTPQVAPAGEMIITDTGLLDLGPLVREISVVAVPIQTFCRPDCKGLCIECGANLNEGPCECDQDEIDPRLAILKKLLNNGTTQKE